MSGVQPQALSDDEFADLMYKAIGLAGALPVDLQKEMLYRLENGGRDREKQANADNPKQLNLF